MRAARAYLRELPLFASLSDAQLNRLLDAIEEQRYQAGAILFREGDPYSGLHIVRSGRVAMARHCGEREQIPCVLGPGSPLDVAALADGGPHAWTARALEPTQIYYLRSDLVYELVEINPAFRVALLQVVSARLRRLAEVISELAFKDVSSRLSGVLFQIAQQEGIATDQGLRIDRRLTARELAARAGTVREVVQRNLRRMEEARLITRRASHIVILDPDGLRRWAE